MGRQHQRVNRPGFLRDTKGGSMYVYNSPCQITEPTLTKTMQTLSWDMKTVAEKIDQHIEKSDDGPTDSYRIYNNW